MLPFLIITINFIDNNNFEITITIKKFIHIHISTIYHCELIQIYSVRLRFGNLIVSPNVNGFIEFKRLNKVK